MRGAAACGGWRHLEALVEVHEDEGALGIEGVDDASHGVHAVAPLDLQPPVLQLWRHHRPSAPRPHAPRAADRRCSNGASFRFHWDCLFG